jgi:anti-sigma B factor antagonist
MKRSSESLQIEITRESSILLIKLLGEVDMRSSPELRNAITSEWEQPCPRLIIDLSSVSYVDSSGVGTLVEAKRHVERTDGRLILVNLQPRVRSVFEISHLVQFFTICQSVDEAREA